ncbi:acyltransferase family protein [Micromonosporaceae bacterium DT194]|uniref:acyltransferase family protein n=1 Tax=Melissospora conviva TaxID=3388432 RepID=UPI003C1F10E2
MNRLPALDSLRAVGALAVVGHHVGFATGVTMGDPFWGGWLARLDAGVAIFFVLSGFLLFRPHAYQLATGGPRPDARAYLWRRGLRILPAYWLMVVVCLTVLQPNGVAPIGDWVRHLTFTQIYQPSQLRAGTGQTWSLATEVLFYAVLPLLAWAALGRRWQPRRAVAIAAVAALTTGAWVTLMGLGVLFTGLHTMWLPSYALWFGAGMVMAVAHVALSTGAQPRLRVLDDLASAPLACWALALALFAVATTPLAGPRDLAEPTAAQFGFKVVLYTVIAVLIFLPAAFGRTTVTKTVLSAGSLRWLGLVSYGMFLWHPFVLEGIYLIGDLPEFSGSLATIFLLTTAGGTILGALSYYLVERPFQRWNDYWPRRRPATTESQSTVIPASAAS